MKICLITGTRAEYGLLKKLMFGIKKNKFFQLKIIVTGMHLSKKFGLTYKEIESDGFKIDKKININIKSDTAESIVNSINLGQLGFVKIYKKLKPDLVLVLGDRYEIFAAVTAACFSRIPVAHLHGGEATQGLVDEALRHSITKMSHFHFVAAKEYKNRVIQLGENPKNVYEVGGLGVDNIKNLKLFSKKNLEKELKFKFNKKNLLINFHPETLSSFSSKKQFKEILSSLSSLKDTNLIFTMPNSDWDGRIIFRMIKKFVKKNKNAFSFISLGQLRFFSCLKYIDGMIGNSSSGLLELPTFKKVTINIGDRQLGRLMAKSIINVKPEKKSILKAIKKMYSKDFQKNIKNTKNPYGNGGASDRIIKTLKKIKLKNVLKKKFYNLKIKCA